jgi:hypothetical protein
MDDGYLNQLGEYLRRSGRNLADGANDTYNALASVANSVPHLPFAQDGISEYNGALTGADVPYYGDDEISAAREYFDRQPRSNTSRLSELLSSAMPGKATGPKIFQSAARPNPAKAPVPSELDEAKAIMEELKRSRAEWEATRGY